MKNNKYKTFPNPLILSGYLLRELDQTGIRTVSFDVFDTLVHRRAHPDAVIDAVGRWLQLALAERGLSQVVSSLEARQRTYIKLTHQKSAQGLDLDVSLDELVLPWVQECVGNTFDGADLLAKELAEIECAYEIGACFCCPDYLNLIKEIKSRGLRIIFISDMYLGAKYVQRILDAKGYSDLFDAGYVSGDYSLLKRTGRLFDAVLDSEGIGAAQLIHIGDSKISDGLRASEKGIKALVHIDKRMVQRHRRMEYDHKRTKIDRSWMGVLAAQYAEAGLQERGTPEEAYGRRVLGPIFTTFIHRLLERCKEEKIEKVYFMAREGYILSRLFDKLAPNVFPKGEKAPQSIYLGVSRLTTFLAAMQSYSLREIIASFNNTPHYSVRTLFAPLKIDDDVLIKISEKYGLSDINAALPPFFMRWPPFIHLLEDREINSIIRDKQNVTKSLLLRYLTGVGFFDSTRVAIVDVGWSGQIQDNLSAAVKDQNNCPQIFGFYLGTTLAAHWRKSPKNWIESTHADESHLGWSSKAAFEFVQGLEAVLRAPHGTVIGYELDGSDVIPLFKNDDDLGRRAEIMDDPMLALFQHGIAEFCGFYTQAMTMFGFSASETLPYSRMMIDRMVRFPAVDEAKWFLSAHNVADLGSSDVCTIGSNHRISVFNFKKLRTALRGSFWKYGIVTKSGNHLLNLFVVVGAVLWSIPRRRQSLDPGIVFNSFAESSVRTGTYAQIQNNHLELVARVGRLHKKCLALGKKRGRIVNIQECSGPISLSEALRSYVAFRMAQLLSHATNRHIPYQDGLSIKPWISRSLYQFRLIQRIRTFLWRR